MEPTATSWTMIARAATGNAAEREAFARIYEPVVGAYLRARWRGIASRREIDDVVQEVFLECFKDGGALERVETRRPGGFRAFLYGVTRNVASRIQERRIRRREVGWSHPEVKSIPKSEDLEQVFDRAWARSIVHQAAERHASATTGDDERRRRQSELLRLRFEEGRPIRAIATLWGVDAHVLHKEYEKARREFERALREVVTFHLPGAPEEVGAECSRLLSLLQ